MANDAQGNVKYYCVVNKSDLGTLENLRKWENLKVAFDESKIWLSNFSELQINAKETKQLPYKEIFYSKNAKLYPQGSLLPSGNEPNFLWTPIQRALPIDLPKINHNFFGIDEMIHMNLITSEIEREATAILVSLDQLYVYTNTHAKIRWKNLRWVILNKKNALVFGTPLLPINAQSYYAHNNMLIPCGYEFELSILTEKYSTKIDPENDCWIVWNETGTYFKIEQKLLKPVSRTSVKVAILVNKKSNTDHG